MFDANELQNPQRAVALIGAILVIAGVYLDWIAWADDDFDDGEEIDSTLSDLADGEAADGGDSEYNANFVLIGGIASLAVAALSRPKLEESIGEGNYPIAVIVVGIIALFAVYSNYSQVTDDIGDVNDAFNDLAEAFGGDGEDVFKVGMGAYACLLGALMVVGSGAWQKFGE